MGSPQDKVTIIMTNEEVERLMTILQELNDSDPDLLGNKDIAHLQLLLYRQLHTTHSQHVTRGET